MRPRQSRVIGEVGTTPPEVTVRTLPPYGVELGGAVLDGFVNTHGNTGCFWFQGCPHHGPIK